MKKCFLMLVVIGSFLCGCGSNEKTPTKNLPPQIDTENNVMPAQQKVVEVAEQATKDTIDQAALCEIVFKSDNFVEQSSALKKITEQPLLTKIVLESGNFNCSISAVDKITEQPLLAKIVLESDNFIFRNSALKKITDPTVLATVASKSTDSTVLEDVINKITDVSVLKKIAAESKDSRIRQIAEYKLKSLTVDTPKVTENEQKGQKDENHAVRELAAKTLTDQSLLAEDVLLVGIIEESE